MDDGRLESHSETYIRGKNQSPERTECLNHCWPSLIDSGRNKTVAGTSLDRHTHGCEQESRRQMGRVEVEGRLQKGVEEEERMRRTKEEEPGWKSLLIERAELRGLGGPSGRLGFSRAIRKEREWVEPWMTMSRLWLQ